MLASFYTYALNFVLYAFVFVQINFVQINTIELKWSWEVRRGSPYSMSIIDPQQEEINAPTSRMEDFFPFPQLSQLETVTTLNTFAFLQ